MRNSKHGLKALVLAMMAALGVMAFGAVGAQAQAPELPGKSTLGEFLVNLGTPNLNPITAFQLGTGNLLVKTRDLKIECTEFHLVDGKVVSSTDAKAEVTFLGCVALNHAGVPLKGCEFKELKTIKAKALALPILHGGQRYILFEPLEGTTELAHILIKSGTVCTLPLNNPVTGSVVAEVVGELEGTSQEIVFSEAIQLLSGDVLKFGQLANTSYVNGKAHVEVEAGKLGVHSLPKP